MTESTDTPTDEKHHSMTKRTLLGMVAGMATLSGCVGIYNSTGTYEIVEATESERIMNLSITNHPKDDGFTFHFDTPETPDFNAVVGLDSNGTHVNATRITIGDNPFLWYPGHHAGELKLLVMREADVSQLVDRGEASGSEHVETIVVNVERVSK